MFECDVKILFVICGTCQIVLLVVNESLFLFFPDIYTVMSSLGLVYAPTSITRPAAPSIAPNNKWTFGGGGGGNKPPFNKQNDSQNAQGGGQNNHEWKTRKPWEPSHGHSAYTPPVLQLEPAVDCLVEYALCDGELLGRHNVVSVELRGVICAEQKKYAHKVVVSLFLFTLCVWIAHLFG